MIRKSLVFVLLAWFFLSCHKQENIQIVENYDFNYFPLDSGVWKIFDVTEIDIDAPSEKYDTISYQIKEVFAGWFLDAANDSMMRIERFIRNNSAHEWREYGVWQAGIKGSDAHQVEENLRYLKIKFPVKLNKNWNGDIFNRLDTNSLYRYVVEAVDKSLVLGNLNFDSVLSIQQKNFETIIDTINFSEKYAYGLGLVAKKQVDAYYDPIDKHIYQGAMFYQIIVDYGK